MLIVAKIDWTAVGSIATALSVLGLVVSLLLLLRQLREMSKATYASTYIAIMGIMQADPVRESRGRVLRDLRSKSPECWDKTDAEHAERVCQTYDTICRLARYGLYPEHWLMDSSGDSLIKCWDILSPLVMRYRQERTDDAFWDDFQWGAEKARLYKTRCQSGGAANGNQPMRPETDQKSSAARSRR